MVGPPTKRNKSNSILSNIDNGVFVVVAVLMDAVAVDPYKVGGVSRETPQGIGSRSVRYWWRRPQ